MRKISSLLCALITATAIAPPAGALRVVVISDLHLLAPSLQGDAFRSVARRDSKLTECSPAILDAICDTVISLQANLLVITGDLTFNGERDSHLYISNRLQKLRAQGVPSLVIPGNHDINNPYSQDFSGKKAVATATITRAEFAEIYHDFGYGGELEPASLSFVNEPAENIVFIGIDSNTDEKNQLRSRGDAKNLYHTGGAVKAETRAWVTEQITKAKADGKCVVALMHHHLVPHFDREERFLPNYVVKDYRAIAEQWANAGLRTIFTGHLHVTDAATLLQDTDHPLTEIATGSATTFPFYLRIVDINANQQALDVHTRYLGQLTGIDDLQQQGRERLQQALPTLIDRVATRLWKRAEPKLPQIKAYMAFGGGKVNLPDSKQELALLIKRHLSGPLSKALEAFVCGNEPEHHPEDILAEFDQGVEEIAAEIMPTNADALVDFYKETLYPMLAPTIKSVAYDLNNVNSNNPARTDDLSLHLPL